MVVNKKCNLLLIVVSVELRLKDFQVKILKKLLSDSKIDVSAQDGQSE